MRKAIKNLEILLQKSKFDDKRDVLDFYKNGLVKDLITVSKRILDIIDKDCIEVVGAPIPMIFFTKLKADIFRYLTEATQGTE